MDDKNKKWKEDSVLDGSAWDNFCDELKQAGKSIKRQGTPEDLFSKAEGYRYLTRLLRAGLENYIESSDPQFPRFFQLANETIKIGNDNPDNIYLNANVDGRFEYRIAGTRGTVPFISFASKTGSYATTGTMEPTGQLDSDVLMVNDDGTFEIIVSTKPHAGNWLRMSEQSSSLVIRQTFHDRSCESAADMSITCISSRNNNYLDAAVFVDQLQCSVDFVKGTANLFIDWMEIYKTHINQLPSDNQQRCQLAGGDSSIHYLQSYWCLEMDEALIVCVPQFPLCKSWNFQLSNYWMESLDYRYFPVSINKHTAVYGDDESVVMVVAHQNPGKAYPNWLHTTGHKQGGMLFRWVEADEYPPVTCAVVKLSELLV